SYLLQNGNSCRAPPIIARYLRKGGISSDCPFWGLWGSSIREVKGEFERLIHYPIRRKKRDHGALKVSPLRVVPSRFRCVLSCNHLLSHSSCTYSNCRCAP